MNYFLNYDKKFTNQPEFYAEISDLGRTIEKLVNEVLSKSDRFLWSVTDIDDVFQDSKVVCLRLAADIMTFINRGDRATTDLAGGLEELRVQLRRKFARLKGSWENLARSVLDYGEPVAFAMLEALVEPLRQSQNWHY